MDESQSGGEITRNAPKGSSFRGGAFRGRFARGGPFRGAREWAGWLLLAAGAVLCVLGWYGVSGERFVEQQIPYLASSTIPGAALIVSGTVLFALRPPSPPEHEDLTDRRVERLYDLLVEPDTDPGPGPDTGAGLGPDPPDSPGPPGLGARLWLAVPGGLRYHRPDCPLVIGKARAEPVNSDAVRTRGLTPCPLCSPPAADAADAADAGPDPATRPGEPAPPSG
ncbi:hypothetical protein [Streptomyces sp. 1331.2]|uniref:hypothetical protein n=1 Tax=Streptomyces sp. 1331.2 TaxID=1938835 RepID=UPI000BDBB433|nr:hypothetical protein [Streptomyces sp. 1331.2]SOB81023.1 hypothetical protein SAMN06272789_1245 [Streptomyces sp. 1331.2]